MKKRRNPVVALAVFCALTFVLTWLGVWAMPIKANTAAILASTSIITGLGIFILQWLDKREIVGLYFLGSVVFKIFALGYLALYYKDFGDHVLWYFLFYWLQLAAEVGYAVQAVKKEAPRAL